MRFVYLGVQVMLVVLMLYDEVGILDLRSGGAKSWLLYLIVFTALHH